eukprot:3218024-Prymnesium_polylepis.1
MCATFGRARHSRRSARGLPSSRSPCRRSTRHSCASRRRGRSRREVGCALAVGGWPGQPRGCARRRTEDCRVALRPAAPAWAVVPARGARVEREARGRARVRVASAAACVHKCVARCSVRTGIACPNGV